VPINTNNAIDINPFRAMFGFLTSTTKELADPLQSPRIVSAWLQQLPQLDVLARQEQVLRAFDAMRKSGRAPDLNRVGGIQFLDAALGSDRRQLLNRYFETLDGSPRLADRLWQASLELTQSFAMAYRAAVQQALSQSDNSRWKAVLPLLLARLIHYSGTDAKLRVFRFERWIPAKWAELHDLYARACALGIEGVPTALGSSGRESSRWSVEQEYVFALLVHQLNTGNLTPAQFDWACVQFRVWCRRLSLATRPQVPDGFVVDFAGRSGLVRRSGQESGPTLRFLDTAPLAAQVEGALKMLRDAERTDKGDAAEVDRERIAILEKVRAVVTPSQLAELRRDERVAVRFPARVLIGIARICSDIAAPAEVSPAEAGDAPEEIEIFAVMPGSRAPSPARKGSAAFPSATDPLWQVRDRSVAGLRIAATGGVGQSLALGTLLAVRPADEKDWALGIVRRLNKLSGGEVEAGVSVIAERPVVVTLHAKGGAGDDRGYVVDGIDLATLGKRFVGLYLAASSPLAARTLVIPSFEYAEGLELTLDTGPSVYTVRLGDVIEQAADWCQIAIQVVAKRAKDA
jgi:cyclic-di-GMP-binding protein